MPDLVASDIIAIVAIVAGVIGTLAGGVIADRRANARAKAERRLQARLRAVEDTQRYVVAMLEHFSNVALAPGVPTVLPNLADYPKVSLGLIGDRDVTVGYLDWTLSEAERGRRGGPPWTQADRGAIRRPWHRDQSGAPGARGSNPRW